MRQTPTMTGIQKASKPLSAAHIALVKLLAGIAVADYLREIAAGEELDERIKEDAHARR